MQELEINVILIKYFPDKCLNWLKTCIIKGLTIMGSEGKARILSELVLFIFILPKNDIKLETCLLLLGLGLIHPSV